MPLIAQPCLDSDALAEERRESLALDRSTAAALGDQAVRAARDGWYLRQDGSSVDWAAAVTAAISAKVSIPPDAPLPHHPEPVFSSTLVTVANEATLGAARRLVDLGVRPLALNMANGITPGGGFRHGARAQEETLCRSSALHATLEHDPMYQAHRHCDDYESSDWMILSPDVPVFRTDAGSPLDTPWLCSFITSAAPYAPRVGQPRSAHLMAARAHRLLEVAAAYGYDTLVLGAWGCGAFHNDPHRTAADFHRLLTGPFDERFREVVFAITDWSPERRYLGPFRDRFATTN